MELEEEEEKVVVVVVMQLFSQGESQLVVADGAQAVSMCAMFVGMWLSVGSILRTMSGHTPVSGHISVHSAVTGAQTSAISRNTSESIAARNHSPVHTAAIAR